ncbi:uncharacterized protein LOC128194315 [Vigna angularis]|uniref:uncharacterized protein LOC128194315 n=1 Tax=Phaseolus angularis TaxID=3914 RepID=UPI0022B3FE94|nr:uncharacterized protein LOC128194315 [Vigna angularis]
MSFPHHRRTQSEMHFRITDDFDLEVDLSPRISKISPCPTNLDPNPNLRRTRPHTRVTRGVIPRTPLPPCCSKALRPRRPCPPISSSNSEPLIPNVPRGFSLTVNPRRAPKRGKLVMCQSLKGNFNPFKERLLLPL